MKFMKNESTLDRNIRAIVGLVAIALGATLNLSGYWPFAFYAVGVIMLVTAIVGFCPLYAVFGISTKKK